MTRLFGLGALLTALVLAVGPAGAVQEKQENQKKGGLGGDPEAMFKKLDADGNGTVTKKEFLKLLDPLRDRLKDVLGDKVEFLDRMLEKVWQQMDPDDKGLNLEQFKEKSGKLGEMFKGGGFLKKKKDAE